MEKKRKIYLHKALHIAIILIYVIAFASCGGGNGGASSDANSGSSGTSTDTQDETEVNENTPAGDLYAGTTIELVQKIIAETNGLPEVVIDAVTSENAPAMLGLLADDFASFIDNAAAATCESDEIAFQAAVVKCKDAGDAEMIDSLIREGFDPGKWVYVFPDRSLTVVSGPYVMLAVGSEAEADSIAATFKKISGGSPKITVFYEGETGG